MCISKWLKKETKKPEMDGLWMESGEALRVVEGEGIKLLYSVLLDSGSLYYYVNGEKWAEVMEYIYFKVEKPKYIEARMDCEDFAFWMKGMVSGFFGLNWFGVVFGESPMGYHAWNILMTENGVMYFEPQTGEFFPPDEKGYVAEYIIM